MKHLKGRRELVYELRSTLIQRAKGYDYTETKTVTEKLKVPENVRAALISTGVKPEDIDNAKVIKTEVTKKHLHPDIAALNLALKTMTKRTGPMTRKC